MRAILTPTDVPNKLLKISAFPDYYHLSQRSRREEPHVYCSERIPLGLRGLGQTAEVREELDVISASWPQCSPELQPPSVIQIIDPNWDRAREGSHVSPRQPHSADIRACIQLFYT